MHLIDYIAYGFHLWYKIKIVREICRTPILHHLIIAWGLDWTGGWARFVGRAEPGVGSFDGRLLCEPGVRPGVGNFDASLLEKPGDAQALSDG